MSTSNATADTTSPSDEAREPCPTPLAWSDVRQSFLTESSPFEVPRSGYVVSGRCWGQGPPLYFLNGLCGDHELFCLLGWLLRDEFRCVAFDYPRVTGCCMPVHGAADMAGDLFAIADSFGDDHISLFATGFGGVTALEAMRENPLRISRAVLQACFARRELSFGERMINATLRWTPGRMSSLPGQRHILWHNHRRWFPPYDSTRWEFAAANFGQSRTKVVARRVSAVAGFDARPWLSRITTPVLVVRSEGDGPVLSACQDELEAGLSLRETEWLHTTGHLSYLTHPHRMAKIVRTFLQNSNADASECAT